MYGSDQPYTFALPWLSASLGGPQIPPHDECVLILLSPSKTLKLCVCLCFAFYYLVSLRPYNRVCIHVCVYLCVCVCVCMCVFHVRVQLPIGGQKWTLHPLASW